ncbi:uncharacterized protein NEMAJ01_1877 [Nematocida major]|uniref:uncharacterized protein n=1 Tax=Nematocida major TaxID=1912982 RepID=UPI0020087C49|nr:uncharacterized protein NEMAJ01_1877 [Nematocida major]KAH9386981.1 hypothetical protein NEMAJ01_1877 [Nematocida major]
MKSQKKHAVIWALMFAHFLGARASENPKMLPGEEASAMESLHDVCIEGLNRLHKVTEPLQSREAICTAIRAINRMNLRNTKRKSPMSNGNHLLNPDIKSMRNNIMDPKTVTTIIMNKFNAGTVIEVDHPRKKNVSKDPKYMRLSGLCLASFLMPRKNTQGLLMCSFLEWPVWKEHSYAINTSNIKITEKTKNFLENDLGIPEENIWSDLCVLRNDVFRPNAVILEYVSSETRDVIYLPMHIKDPLLRVLLILFAGKCIPDTCLLGYDATVDIYSNPIDIDRDVSHLLIVKCMLVLACSYISPEKRRQINKMAGFRERDRILRVQYLYYKSAKFDSADSSVDELIKIFSNPEKITVITMDSCITQAYMFEYSRIAPGKCKYDPTEHLKPRVIEKILKDRKAEEKKPHVLQVKTPASKAEETVRIECPEGRDWSNSPSAAVLVFMWSDPETPGIVWVQISGSSPSSVIFNGYDVNSPEFRQVLYSLFFTPATKMPTLEYSRALCIARNNKSTLHYLAWIDMAMTVNGRGAYNDEITEKILDKTIEIQTDRSSGIDSLRAPIPKEKDLRPIWEESLFASCAAVASYYLRAKIYMEKISNPLKEKSGKEDQDTINEYTGPIHALLEGYAVKPSDDSSGADKRTPGRNP